MRPTWGTVLVAAALGCGAGVVGTRALSEESARSDAGATAGAAPDAPHPPTPRAGSGSALPRGEAPRPRASPAAPPAPAASVSRSPDTHPAAGPAADAKAAVEDLARARTSKDRKLLDQALGRLTQSDDPAAHAALIRLLADPTFEFPEPRSAFAFADSPALRASRTEGWVAAARSRWERDHDRPGWSWDSHVWLKVVAAHGDATDLAWVADQYDRARERQSEAIAALGLARPDLAREAIQREMRRQPLRRGDGVWGAIDQLRKRSAPDAFLLLDEALAGPRVPIYHETGEVLRAWVQCAPDARLPQVRWRIHELATSDLGLGALNAVQTLADRGADVSDFGDFIASAGRELRRLVDEEKEADGTGPFYAIQYHKVAQTPANVAALEYAVQQLGKERAKGCADVLAQIRGNPDWK